MEALPGMECHPAVFFVSLGAKGPGSLRMAILGVQNHWLIDNYVSL